MRILPFVLGSSTILIYFKVQIQTCTNSNTSLGFPTPAAYAAYTGRGYSSYPGFGLASGIAGYPAGKFLKSCMS